MSVETAAIGESARGLTAERIDPLRYDGQYIDNWESTGLICDMIPSGSRILDVGCGTGSVSVLIRDTCHATVIGIEPNEMRAQAAMRRGLEVHVGVLDASTAAAVGKFDVVIFADVLEHVPDPILLLEAARPVLRDGGSVVISTPNVAHWSVRWDLFRGRFNYQSRGIMDATHLRWFTRATLESLFTEAGYTVDRYQVSAGLWMPEYRFRRPWSWMSQSLREKIVHAGVKHYPAVFGCQHVVKASLKR
jgi:methionine biosynthesis protein MetW